MAIEDFFDHRCSIYHTQQESTSPGYGLPGSPKFKYPKQPDLEEVPCHFGVRSTSIQIAQQQPQNDMDSDIKLTLPAGTDVRLEYTAGQPRNIRGHHMTVKIYRTAQQRPL